MGIVSNLPFELNLIQHFPVLKVQNASLFCHNRHDAWQQDVMTLEAEENDELQLYFYSKDRKARLYIELLDTVPNESGRIHKDEQGHSYCNVSKDKLILYKTSEEYDTLRVGRFLISVFCNDSWYYGIFQIAPKPMSMEEWTIMRDDLETEMKGLALDITKKRTNFGKHYNEEMFTGILHDFLIIQKYSKKVLMALSDISHNPRSEIKTVYENVKISNCANYRMDAQTMKRYAMTAGAEPVVKVPVKTIEYDIQDNRLLKKIVLLYEKKIKQFITLVEDMEKEAAEQKYFQEEWQLNLITFKETAIKLQKLTAILKAQEWYGHIGNLMDAYIPHSFILDARYNILYQMYQELKKKGVHEELNPAVTYTWKKSSSLYEIWCYFKICHLLQEKYSFVESNWSAWTADGRIKPELCEDTRMTFENDKLRLEIIYDRLLPLSKFTTTVEKPLYIAKHHSESKTHNRPDIMLHVFSKEENYYLGSVLLECKYRKLFSFWYDNTSRSSRGQLETYYNNARSIHLLNGLGDVLQMHPVTKVIALTPDENGEGIWHWDFNIAVKTFKASKTKEWETSLKNELFGEIARIEERYIKVEGLLSGL